MALFTRMFSLGFGFPDSKGKITMTSALARRRRSVVTRLRFVLLLDSISVPKTNQSPADIVSRVGCATVIKND